MDNKSIAAFLEEIGVLIEFTGGNPFKSRAHYNAARTASGMTEPIKNLLEKGELGSIRGFGKGMVDKVSELLMTGTIQELENLRSSVPGGLFETLKIPGMGPKRVRAVYEKLGVSTIGELEYACIENRLAILDGFGLKSQENVLAGIEQLRRYRGLHLYPAAAKQAERLLEVISEFPHVDRAATAGSIRRRKETIKDIDILASVEEKYRPDVTKLFSNLPEIEKIIVSGTTKTSVIITGGMNVDLRLVNDNEFPFALQYFTGSKEHNTALRRRAKSKNMKLNEYGLYADNSKTAFPCSDEIMLYNVLGLSYIVPELRENNGELDAAESDNLPSLVTNQDIKGILHVHTTYSDGRNTLEEMVHACIENGYSYIGISDHSRSAFYANGLSIERIREQHTEIDSLQHKYPGFRIFKGIESDILTDGSLDYPEEILQSFDFVIASIHSRLNMDESEATGRLEKALKNPYTTILGHPTGRLLLSRESYPLDWDSILETARVNNVILELNANPFRLDIDWQICREAKKRGIKVAVNPDAHSIEGIADIDYGIGTARKGWLENHDIISTLTADKLEKLFIERKKTG